MFTNRRENSLPVRRIRQSWPKDKIFKILSLDGGGIRGVYSAEILRRCEERFCQGESVSRYFDMIAGTSTGGIIALGLGIQIPASEILELYRDDGRKIFPIYPNNYVLKTIRSILWCLRPKLDYNELETALKRRFGDNILGYSRSRLVIPAFMVPKTEIAVFKTDHHQDFKNDYLTPMWKVARATAAAPTYLKGLEHQESGRIFIDGGDWANNPLMVALVDAMSSYDISFDQIRIFIIGTGNRAFTLSRSSVLSGLLAWRAVIKAAMFLTTDNVTAQAKLLLGPDRCVRLEPSDEDAVIELDDYDGAFLRLPDLAHEHFDKEYENIEPFFKEMSEPREVHYAYSLGNPRDK